MPVVFTWKKKERLKSRKELEQLFEKGQRYTQHPLRMIFLFRQKPGLQIGVGAGTKFFKKSTDRNRVKRMMREACRLNKIPLEETLSQHQRGLSVFFLYQGRQLPVFSELQNAVKKSFDHLLNHLNENTVTHT